MVAALRKVRDTLAGLEALELAAQTDAELLYDMPSFKTLLDDLDPICKEALGE